MDCSVPEFSLEVAGSTSDTEVTGALAGRLRLVEMEVLAVEDEAGRLAEMLRVPSKDVLAVIAPPSRRRT